MARTINGESRIGRRLRLRDLHVFFAVVQSGCMARAAAELRVKQPSVSKAIGDLEAALGVRLFDRSPQGVEPTIYGDALVECGMAVFDELKQGIKKILNDEFLFNDELVVAAACYLSLPSIRKRGQQAAIIIIAVAQGRLCPEASDPARTSSRKLSDEHRKSYPRLEHFSR